MRARSEGFQLEYKPHAGGDVVMNADKESDIAMRFILDRIATELFPDGIRITTEEGGKYGPRTRQELGADSLDGTTSERSGSQLSGPECYYSEDGLPQAAAAFQHRGWNSPILPGRTIGRLVWAIRGEGAWQQPYEFINGSYEPIGQPEVVRIKPFVPADKLAMAVPVSPKMLEAWKVIASALASSKLVGAATGFGCAVANVFALIDGWHDLYANMGSGDKLDLMPLQLIFREAGGCVLGLDGKEPVWRGEHGRVQPVFFGRSKKPVAMVFTELGLSFPDSDDE